jgi:hypothetical protein
MDRSTGHTFRKTPLKAAGALRGADGSFHLACTFRKIPLKPLARYGQDMAERASQPRAGSPAKNAEAKAAAVPGHAGS